MKMVIKVNIPETSENKFKNWIKVKNTIANIAYELFNEANEVSIVFWDHENGKENYKILKQTLWIKKLEWKNISVKQMVDKQIDEYHIAEAFLLEIKWENWEKVYKNVTSIFETNWKEKILKHVHISEPRKLDWKKVVNLGLKKEFKKNFLQLNEEASKEKWILEKELLPLIYDKKHTKTRKWIWPEREKRLNPQYIAKKIMTEYWWKALLKWSEDVVKLFSPNALLKWTVVQHLSVWDNFWVKDYFDHFCESNPQLEVKDLQTKWLTEWKSILWYW